MFFNVLINIDNKEQLNTDCFYYNEVTHCLRYHLPYQDNDAWRTISDVKCEVGRNEPMICIYAKTI